MIQRRKSGEGQGCYGQLGCERTEGKVGRVRGQRQNAGSKKKLMQGSGAERKSKEHASRKC
eukprot:scaffold95557_cov18-Tisochrysis_lutea.AAC.1